MESRQLHPKTELTVHAKDVSQSTKECVFANWYLLGLRLIWPLMTQTANGVSSR